MKKHLFPRGLVQNIARDLVSLSSVNRELTNSKTIIIVIWYLCFADNLLKHSFCFLTLVHIRKASITVCDQTYAEMRAYTNFRIQGTGFCICPRAKTVQGYKETWSYSDDQHLEAKFCPLVTTWTLGIAFCAYGLWANLAWESPYSEVFPWVRKPVNVTWSEILQKHKQDLSWNTLNSTEFRHVNCPELHPTRDLCLGVFHVFQKHKENPTADAANAELTCLLSDNPKLCKCTLSLLEPTAKHLIKVTLVNEEKCTYPFSQEHGLRVPNKTPKLLEL